MNRAFFRPLVTGFMMLASTVAVARSRETPAATPSGAPVTCIPIVQIRTTHVRDDRTIDFVMNNNKVYRNTLPYECPELGSEGAFSYETSISELCNVDIISVFRNSSPIRRGASCGLGMFQPVAINPDK